MSSKLCQRLYSDFTPKADGNRLADKLSQCKHSYTELQSLKPVVILKIALEGNTAFVML